MSKPYGVRALLGWSLAAGSLSAVDVSGQAPARQGTTSPPATRSLLREADAAYDDGDRVRARELYARVLAADSGASRAVFRLAQLEESPSRALALFERYERLEPGDAWGAMATGDALGKLHRYDDALRAYTRAAAIVPAERDVTLGRARLLLAADRPMEAARVLEARVQTASNDAEALDMLGRAWLRAGRPKAAAAAFARAKSAGNVRGVANREALARSLAAPALEPLVGAQRDSDGNRTVRLGAIADFMPGDGVRVGASVERAAVSDGIDEWSGPAFSGRLSARPTPGVRFDAQGGVLRMAPATGVGETWSVPQGDARIRLRAPRDGASIELRAQQLALGTAPVLVQNQVFRREARVSAEVPMGFLRLRAMGRAGEVHATGEAPNARTGAEAALMVPARGRARVLAQYRVLTFERASSAGYFAPRRAETIEGGAYFESDGEGRVSLALDLGAGGQRVAAQGEAVGPFSRALRAWGYAAVNLGGARSLYVELEAYDAPFAAEGAVTTADWRYGSVTAGLRWAFR